jgi:hypothetical protein
VAQTDLIPAAERIAIALVRPLRPFDRLPLRPL